MVIHKLKLITFRKNKNVILHVHLHMHCSCLYIISNVETKCIEQKMVFSPLVKKLPNFWNLNVHYCVLRSTPLAQSYFFKLHFNIILPSMHRSAK